LFPHLEDTNREEPEVPRQNPGAQTTSPVSNINQQTPLVQTASADNKKLSKPVQESRPFGSPNSGPKWEALATDDGRLKARRERRSDYVHSQYAVDLKRFKSFPRDWETIAPNAPSVERLSINGFVYLGKSTGYCILSIILNRGNFKNVKKELLKFAPKT